MQRKNPGLSSLPNAPIDLTPLLDVIFIFLFVVIIGYSAKAQEAQAEAARKNELLSEEVENLKADLENETALREMYEERLSEYENDIIGGRVKIVTISCNWNETDSRKRQIRVVTSDGGYDPISITADNQENGYARLGQILEEYAKEHSDSVIILALDSERILHRDRIAINKLMDEIRANYTYVY